MTSRHIPHLLGWGLWIAVFVYLLALPRSLNPSDEALFLYGAKRVLQGQALYRDVFEFITPAGFYLFALVFAVAGTSLLAARVAMVAIIAFSCVLIYVLARKVAGIVEAVLAALVFAVACYPGWNMASPHWLSTALCLATAAALLREPGLGSARATLALAGALGGLTFCTQQTQGAAVAVWLVTTTVAFALSAPGGERLRRCARALGWVAGGWAVIVLAVLGYSVWRASLAELVDAVFTFVLDRYGSSIAGRATWGGVGLFTQGVALYSWPWLARAVPPILGAEAVTLLWTLARRRGRVEVIRGSLLLLAALMAASILYYPDIVHVLFVMPFPLIVAARLVHGVRSSRLARRCRALPALRALVAAAVLLAVLYKGWATLVLARSWCTERYPSAFGTLAGSVGSRAILEGVQTAMGGASPAPRVFFSYPNDASLYLSVPGDNPTPFSLMRPGYSTPEQYRTVLDTLERERVNYVVVNTAGVAPNDPVMEFLTGRYEQRAAVGPWGVYFVYGRIDGK